MVNKIVKVSDVGLLSYFYPSFKVRSELSFSDRDNDVIYIGGSKRNIKDYLSKRTHRFISVVGMPDLDLTNREVLLKWCFSKHSKEPSEKILSQIKDYDDEYFIHCCKLLYLTGIWRGYKTDGYTLYNLFDSTSGSLRESLKIYFSLLSSLPAPVIESSFLTFLSRVFSCDEQTVSPNYLKLLKQCNSKYKSKIPNAVLTLGTASSLRDDLRFVNLLLDLR